jgi:ribosome modulation factor
MKTPNPYDDDQPDLRDAWADGHRAGRGNHEVNDVHWYDKASVKSAWLDGYIAAVMRPGRRESSSGQ